MKKTYMTPEMEVQSIEMESMVCESVPLRGDSIEGEDGFERGIEERLFGDFTPEPLNFLW